jgi:hypothetical protein
MKTERVLIGSSFSTFIRRFRLAGSEKNKTCSCQYETINLPIAPNPRYPYRLENFCKNESSRFNALCGLTAVIEC